MDNDIYHIKKNLKIGNKEYSYFSLAELKNQNYPIETLPFSIRILLENTLRHYDNFSVTRESIETLLHWTPKGSQQDIPFMPGRVLMQDFTGVPALVDLAALRSEIARKGKDPEKINPLIPVDLVIDHSIQVDSFGTKDSYKHNMKEEYKRNTERYQFLKWAQQSFENFHVVPPGMGICHQVNLEYLSKGVLLRNGEVFPDTLVGTDSHTPMVNGIGVLAWGVGGIEAEAAILGQPIYFIMPQVIGLKLTNSLPLGTTATDLVLTVAEMLRDYGVVGKFVEVFGPGLDHLSVPDRATIGNMSPEFGCTVTYFPIDEKTLDYMRLSNRSEDHIQLVEKYCKTNMLWREHEDQIRYTTVLELDLSTIEPTVAGPKKPQEKIFLKDFKNKFIDLLDNSFNRKYLSTIKRSEIQEVGELKSVMVKQGQERFLLSDGSVTLAAITSCTNTSNPYVMIGAGLVARNARKRGIEVKPWVKTSLAPGSKVVTDYLNKADLMKDLEALHFHLVGYGCTSCIGNSGPLSGPIAKAIDEKQLIVASVLSGNRNFEARIHPQIKMNFLMSPMLVVAYALSGRVDIDWTNEPLSFDSQGEPVFLKDIWPSNYEIEEILKTVLSSKDFANNYDKVYAGDETWKDLKIPSGKLFDWNCDSTYIKEIPFFRDLPDQPQPLKDIINARALLVLGDSITTDHISPAGVFNEQSASGKYLQEQGIEIKNFNTYGSRRGNDEVMVRGTFANVRINNKLASKEGGYTKYLPTGEECSVYDASVKYREMQIPLVVLAGKEYGSGSSRDWAAKGTILLGINAVLAESYERIHRSNLVGMGVLPLQYKPGNNAESLGLTGYEIFTITHISDITSPLQEVLVTAKNDKNEIKEFIVIARLDSNIEIEYYRNGGILQYVLREFLRKEN